MKLRPVFNKKFGQWKICHDQWCKPGETSIVATIMTSFDETKGEMDHEKDGKLAQLICDRFNAAEDA